MIDDWAVGNAWLPDLFRRCTLKLGIMTLVPGTLLLTRKDVSELLTLKDCVQAVEQAFRLQGEGRAPAPGVLGVHAHGGGFHIKAGTLPLSRNYFAAKANANFPGNPARAAYDSGRDSAV